MKKVQLYMKKAASHIFIYKSIGRDNHIAGQGKSNKDIPFSFFRPNLNFNAA